jgi:ABC-2 type transport system permease protein
VLGRELVELWIGGRALNLLVLFGFLMSGTAFLLATNNELSLTPTRQVVVVTLQAAITFGMFLGLVISAESISGERERATLEPLLLAPSGRRSIVAGKLLAALSPWPVALALAIPYVAVLGRGDAVVGQAIGWAAILGTTLAISFTTVGMLVSIWSGSNRTSLLVGLLVYVATLLPQQLPGEFTTTPAGAVVQAIVPLEAARQFLLQTLIDGKALDGTWPLLAAPLAFGGVVLVLLFGWAAPRLRLEVARPAFGRGTSEPAGGTR